MREVETRLIIYSLLLRDKKVVQHLFRQRKCFRLPNMIEDEDCQSPMAAGISSWNADTPSKIMKLAKNKTGTKVVDNGLDHSVSSVIETVKNELDEQGREFMLEEDIDQVADLFIQRFHHQIRLQNFHFEPTLSCSPD